MRQLNSGYTGVDKRRAAGGIFGILKHYLERLNGEFRAEIPVPVPEGFNLGAGETAATIEARTSDPAGYITWATDSFDVYVSDGNDNWAITINRPSF